MHPVAEAELRISRHRTVDPEPALDRELVRLRDRVLQGEAEVPVHRRRAVGPSRHRVGEDRPLAVGTRPRTAPGRAVPLRVDRQRVFRLRTERQGVARLQHELALEGLPVEKAEATETQRLVAVDLVVDTRHNEPLRAGDELDTLPEIRLVTQRRDDHFNTLARRARSYEWCSRNRQRCKTFLFGAEAGDRRRTFLCFCATKERTHR